MQTDERYKSLKSGKLKAITKIQSEIRRSSGDFLRREGFIEISPVIISQITDPLFHLVDKREIEYQGKRFKLTHSMIFHKQIALLVHEKIFAFSPNIRLEPIEFLDTKRHLIEFTQLDLEVKEAKRRDVISLGEELLMDVISSVKNSCKEELSVLDRKLKLPSRPFEQTPYQKAYEKCGPDFENILSYLHKEPFWIVDFPKEMREFYDREDPARPGVLLDMDLVYPEGYGEALSGGEREHEHKRVSSRIKSTGLSPENFQPYMEFLEKGLPSSAGFGIGIERLTRWICGLSGIEETTLFPKLPGGEGI